MRDHERATPKEEVDKLSMTHMALTWVVTAIGVGLSAVAFKWELARGRWLRSKATHFNKRNLKKGWHKADQRKLVKFAVNKAIKDKILAKYDTYLA